jgi:hypothetical protein
MYQQLIQFQINPSCQTETFTLVLRDVKRTIPYHFGYSDQQAVLECAKNSFKTAHSSRINIIDLGFPDS